MMSRRQARKHIFNLIFQTEFHKDTATYELIKTYTDEYDEYDNSNEDFIKSEYHGVVDNIASIDEAINKASRGWSVERLPKVELAILRLATYEILYSEVPDKVAANEAVILAKEFGTDKSPSFVNGVLGGIVRNKENQ